MAVACLAIFFALGFIFLKIADRQPMAGRDKTEHNIKISKQERNCFEIFCVSLRGSAMRGFVVQ